MAAALVRAHKISGDKGKHCLYQNKFIDIVSDFKYWQRRVVEFPELLDFADTDSSILKNSELLKMELGEDLNYATTTNLAR